MKKRFHKKSAKKQMPTIKISREKQVLLIVLGISFLLSVVLGAIIANATEDAGFFGQKLNDFLAGMKTTEKSGVSFLQVYFKYLKYAVVIWLGGFIPFGICLAGGVLIFRGISLGFTTAVLLRNFGAKGAILATISYLPQNILLIPLYLCLTYFAIIFAFGRSLPAFGKGNLRREKQRKLAEYGILLGGTMVLLFFVGFLEAKIIPVFLKGAIMAFGLTT